MKFLHTMVRVSNLEESLKFYCDALGLVEIDRRDYEKGRFTLVYLAAPEDLETAKENKSPTIELTYNWDERDYKIGDHFGHLAFRVNDIYAVCYRLMEKKVTILRPPRDGHMAFIKSPDGISIELIQKGDPLSPEAPWKDMENQGSW